MLSLILNGSVKRKLNIQHWGMKLDEVTFPYAALNIQMKFLTGVSHGTGHKIILQNVYSVQIPEQQNPETWDTNHGASLWPSVIFWNSALTCR